MKFKRKFIQPAFFALLASALISTQPHSAGFPPPSVNVVSAQIKSLAPTAWVSGTVVSPNNAEIAAEVSGRLTEIAQLGSQVQKGQLIAKVDDRALILKIQEQQALLASSQSKLNFLQSEVARKKALAKQNLSAMTDLDETISQRDSAQAELDAASARLQSSKQDLDFSQLKAPFAGMVAERLASVGEYTNSGNAIIRLVETENLEASVFAPITAYQFLSKAQTLAVESPLGQGRAHIKSLIPIADNRSHLMEVRLDMSEFNWPVGLSIKVAISSGEKSEVLTVPRDALVLRREGATVFRINSDNQAEQIAVKVGIGAGELVQVIGELNPGDSIVIRGAETLRAGQTVQIKQDNSQLVSGSTANAEQSQ